VGQKERKKMRGVNQREKKKGLEKMRKMKKISTRKWRRRSRMRRKEKRGRSRNKDVEGSVTCLLVGEEGEEKYGPFPSSSPFSSSVFLSFLSLSVFCSALTSALNPALPPVLLPSFLPRPLCPPPPSLPLPASHLLFHSSLCLWRIKRM
jgi:hypothetical protein